MLAVLRLRFRQKKSQEGERVSLAQKMAIFSARPITFIQTYCFLSILIFETGVVGVVPFWALVVLVVLC